MINNKVQKFKKKPIVIEAMKVNAGNIYAIQEWCGDKVETGWLDNGHPYVIVQTLEGDMTCNFGDWVIKGVEGEFYPCKGSIFNKSYEKVEE